MTEKTSSSLTGNVYRLFTGLAAVITALGGLVYAFSETGLMQSFLAEPTPAKEPVEEIRQQQALVGWTIIARFKQGRYQDLKIAVAGGSPAVGGSYDVVADSPLFQDRPVGKGDRARMTSVGTVHRGDSVKIMDLYMNSSSRKAVPVWAKIRADTRSRQERRRGS